ncbi:MAG TPA: glycosyltransferase [Candidatus Baltobacteraceae bacterium]|nr:glycosyltransferase [Candidatus Baltobacteraceae bacterium]
MRRVLLVSYWVPPRNGIGTVRSAHLLKYLAEFGWNVTTLTAAFSDGRHASASPSIETRYWDLKGAVKRFLGMGDRTAHEALNVHVPAHGTKKTLGQRLIAAAGVPLTYPDEHAGWLPFAAQAARSAAASGNFDAVLTSGPPVTTNMVAALSHGRLPWIADMRDLWAENDSEERGALRMLLDDKLERFCLSKASSLIATSDLSARRFKNRYPRVPVFSISTGFDAAEWEHVPFEKERQCTLCYAGTLYSGRRDPSTLFAALRRIFDRGLAQAGELRVDLYAPREPWLLELVSRFGLQDAVRVHGLIDRGSALAAQRRADRLIVLLWDGATAQGVVPGKLFEYFGARRAVLAIGGPPTSSVDTLLKETGAGNRVRTIDEIEAEVLTALSEHRAGTLRITPPSAVGAYSGRECARRFAQVLDQACCARKTATAIPAKTTKYGMDGK